MDEMNVGKDVGAVTQAVHILRSLADANTPLGVTALARAAKVSPSTTLNILRTLIGHKLVGFSAATKTYQLDVGLLELSRSLLNRSNMELLQPQLQSLTRRFEATATVWQTLGDKQILVGRVVPDEGIHIEFPIASRVSAYAGATGRVLIAMTDMPEEEIRRALVRVKWNEPISFERYMKELQLTRQRGYAVDAGVLLRSVTSVASAIADLEGRPRMAVAVHTFLGQLSATAIKELGQELKSVCAQARVSMYGKRVPTGD